MGKPLSLKQYILSIFLCSMLAIFIAVVAITNFMLESVIKKNISSEYASSAKQVYLVLENVVSSLNHVSQQLITPSVVNHLEEYLSTSDSYTKIDSGNQIRESMNLITFTNQNIGLTVFAAPDAPDILFSNGNIRNNIDYDSLPILADYGTIQYFGPYQSKSSSVDRTVIACLREIEIDSSRKIYLYIESAFRTVEDSLDAYVNHEGTSILFLNNTNTVTYSQSDRIPIGTSFGENGTAGESKDYFWFKETATQGWSLVLLVDKNKYNAEKSEWYVQMLLLWIAIVVLCLIFGLTLWKKVNRPIEIFSKEIDCILDEGPPQPLLSTNIQEYDYLLERFGGMKQQIKEMLIQVAAAEKEKSALEVEKLRYQINPHFLMNTLNTVHWMSIMNNQQEIDNVVQSLNKLLLYNLNKESTEAVIAQEFAATKEYLSLQQVRYDFSFSSTISPQTDALLYPCPKFILQPLAENALYHGFRENMHLQLNVRVGAYIYIDVIDDGLGMEAELVQKLNNGLFGQLDRKKGLGIGLGYVYQVTAQYYDGKAKITVESKKGEGTTVHLVLPIMQ